MNVCYLINQYPKISHTFIRREILALEELGAVVKRVSIRRPPEPPVDAVDKAEELKTDFLLDGKFVFTLIKIVLCVLVTLPSFIKALTASLQLGRRAGGAYVKNLFYLLEAAWLLNYCKKHRVGHVHAHFGTNPAAVAYLCRLMGGPEYSFTVHGPEEFDAPIALSLTAKIREAKFVAAITSYCKSQLYRWADFGDWDKIVEIHCAIDSGMLASSLEEVDRYRLVSIGRLCEQKGQLILLRAIKALMEKHPRITLHLVGDGDYRQYFESFIKQEGLLSNVKILGWMSTQSIISELDKCTAMVLPSFAEGLPVVIMESFARSRPVITTYIAGIPELVSQSNGWLVPAGDEEALVKAIDELLTSSMDDREAKGRAGYAAVLERHDSKKEAVKLLNMFKGK
ncbi:glycosyltransferase family 4 protein [Marinagarivorans cellulosilyticus]|uniref:Glycosyl transferase family 1 domain-containing protein n=1 Tax=Marinagarivorans cellulosilyticus TaxID=2721545 RepID=A0AAN2BKI8_9GAMM|nr:glycosyltransferase family 4 protein [Marinagarivorans cellulosilyticus]BCD98056.1 hypothetical protein MARGE09_P2257 [Marinagarivorans cellulosilyticus]